jgi:hypothetical protein
MKKEYEGYIEIEEVKLKQLDFYINELNNLLNGDE